MYLRPSPHLRQACAGAPRSRQRGVVLLVALIILVALTLAGVALIRSVDTANLIAGNQSFHQAAVHAGERSTEIALNNWLQGNNGLGDTDLHDHSAANGYRARREDPVPGVSWDAFWIDTLEAQAVVTPGVACPADPQPTDVNADAAGNTVCYVIHRLCDPPTLPAAPHLANCATQPSAINSGGSFGAGSVTAITNNQVYYRITTRVRGPRNTVAYIQTIVAL
ncbi:MAG: Tfp pilus assembly protein PilX [Candidatus Accumulibacter regalis]|uniref:Tfp pilus assembly protein PilX n=1 Tax=Accumulibacter regalis TaxID=522306 RepID=A0A011RDJ5_ACCRE|nr:hypothetical protein [Accumulibacter sp.]EXI89299.1 MAG: Tfp pilus assembly protein PilX [Candidatus Accumulibacter regalis]HRE69310.1 hypothetical protein [Accumulibacter sp.]